MRYLAISGEDSSTYLLVCDKSCFVHSKSVHVLLAQARPAMINHHTSYHKWYDNVEESWLRMRKDFHVKNISALNDSAT